MAPKLARRIASPRLAELASTDLAQALAAQPVATRSEQDNATIWERLIALPLAAQYQRAFVSATGLLLRFAPTVGLAELERLSGPHANLRGRSSRSSPEQRRSAERELRPPHPSLSRTIHLGNSIAESLMPDAVPDVPE